MKMNINIKKTYENPERELLFYDIEVYPNYFMLYGETESGDVEFFDSRDTVANIKSKLKYLMKTYYLVGYNNYAFDDKMISVMLNAPYTDIIYHTSCKLIDKDTDKMLFKVNYNLVSFDLFKDIGGFVSLKQIMCNMGLNIEETPTDFHKDIDLTDENLINEVIHYCQNDVRATKELAYKLMPTLNYRVWICEQAGYWSRGTNISMTNKVFAESPKYNALKLLKLPLKNKEVEQRFNYLDGQSKYDEQSSTVINIYGMDVKYSMGGGHGINDKHTRTLIKNLWALDYTSLYPWETILLNLYGDNTYKYKDLLIKRTQKLKPFMRKLDEYIEQGLDDIDLLKSWFKEFDINAETCPNLKGKSLNFWISVTHELLQHIDDMQLCYKLALNSLYGSLGNEFFINKDRHKMYSIALSGQIMVTYLADVIAEFLPDAEFIQLNTDGIYFKCDCTENDIQPIIDKVREVTKLGVELDKYSLMYQKDVNNYFAIKESGKIVTKGTHLCNIKGNALTSNNEYGIVDIMLLNKLAYDKPYHQTINEHKDKLYMFQKLARVTEAFDYIQDEGGNIYQRVNRVFATTSGTSTLYKIKTDDGGNVIKKAKVSRCPEMLQIYNDDIRNMTCDDLPIDYAFYIKEAENRRRLWI